MRILHVSAGAPGLSGDSTVFKSTELFKSLRHFGVDDDNWRGFIPPGGFIIGDMAYPNLDWLLVPNPDPSGSGVTILFCDRIRAARRVVERVFGCVLYWSLHVT